MSCACADLLSGCSAKRSHRAWRDSPCGRFARGPLLLQGRRRQGTRTMQAYLARRLLALVPALFFASLIVFVIVRLVPGNIIDMMLAQNDVGADKLSRDQLIATLGLDRPMWQQYFTWIGGILVHGDPDRDLFGDPAGHRRRLSHPLVLDPDAGGAELLDGHHGDGVPVDLVGLVAAGEIRRLHRRPRAKPQADDLAGAHSGHRIV